MKRRIYPISAVLVIMLAGMASHGLWAADIGLLGEWVEGIRRWVLS